MIRKDLNLLSSHFYISACERNSPFMGPSDLIQPRCQIHHSAAQRGAQRLWFSAFETPAVVGKNKNPGDVSTFSPCKRP